jgi:hypothetical protein
MALNRDSSQSFLVRLCPVSEMGLCEKIFYAGPTAGDEAVLRRHHSTLHRFAKAGAKLHEQLASGLLLISVLAAVTTVIIVPADAALAERSEHCASTLFEGGAP